MNDYIYHKDYKTCKNCGSNLDHGERCDCQDTKCECCGKTLKWGRFAHEQIMCWECYKKTCNEAIALIPFPKDQKVLQYAVAVVAESFGEEY